jgi:hypothetical protein
MLAQIKAELSVQRNEEEKKREELAGFETRMNELV